MKKDKVTINYKGQSVDCYGDFTEESNIQIACSNMPDAEIVENWNYGTDEAFTNFLRPRILNRLSDSSTTLQGSQPYSAPKT
mgnify:CR=1 FL=1